MDLSSNHNSPVVTDPAPVNQSSLGLPSSLMSCSSTMGYSAGLFVHTSPEKRDKLDEVHSQGWLDAMMASSPTNKSPNNDIFVDSSSDENESVYGAWLVNYPSALYLFEHIVECTKNKRVALFLDYDGTLSPIVDNPDHAFMSEEMRAAVKDVARHFPTAIISGRSCSKVFQFVKLTELHYAGSHGMDIMGPIRESESAGHRPNSIRSTDTLGNEVNAFQPASEFLPMINEVFNILRERVKDIEGARTEDNKFCVSVHYRNVAPQDYERIYQCVTDILDLYPRLHLTYGRKVLEVRPVIDWNKGNAVEFLLESLGLGHDDVFPIYIGDDRTDEDAFKVLRESNRGFGILVSSAAKKTDAFYSLRNPSEVMEFLKLLVRWKECVRTEEEQLNS